MQITINNETYNYEMNGTIGPAFVVEQMSGETFNPWGRKDQDENGNWVEVEKANPMHSVLLMLVILQFSNPDKKEVLTLDFLLSNLTTKLMNELTQYTVKRWAELEGWKEPSEGEPQDTEGGDSKNA